MYHYEFEQFLSGNPLYLLKLVIEPAKKTKTTLDASVLLDTLVAHFLLLGLNKAHLPQLILIEHLLQDDALIPKDAYSKMHYAYTLLKQAALIVLAIQKMPDLYRTLYLSISEATTPKARALSLNSCDKAIQKTLEKNLSRLSTQLEKTPLTQALLSDCKRRLMLEKNLHAPLKSYEAMLKQRIEKTAFNTDTIEKHRTIKTLRMQLEVALYESLPIGLPKSHHAQLVDTVSHILSLETDKSALALFAHKVAFDTQETHALSAILEPTLGFFSALPKPDISMPTPETLKTFFNLFNKSV